MGEGAQGFFASALSPSPKPPPPITLVPKLSLGTCIRPQVKLGDEKIKKGGLRPSGSTRLFSPEVFLRWAQMPVPPINLSNFKRA